MTDLGTMAIRLLQETRQSTAGSSGSGVQAQVRLAIHQAIQTLRFRPFPWNVGKFTLTLVVDQTRYEKNAAGGSDPTELPADWLRVEGDILTFVQAGSTAEVDVRRVPPETFDSLERDWSASSSWPYAWRDRADGLDIVPPPDAADAIKGRYLLDLGLPTATQAAGVWTFSADTYTNAWFKYDQGEPLTRSLAGQFFCERYLQPTDMSRTMGRGYAEQASLLLGERAQMDNAKTIPLRVSGYLGALYEEGNRP